MSEKKKNKKKGIQAINEQPGLLKQDHEQGTRRAIYLKRADDFGVHISQIKNWHKRYRKQGQVEVMGLWQMCRIYDLFLKER